MKIEITGKIRMSIELTGSINYTDGVSVDGVVWRKLSLNNCETRRVFVNPERTLCLKLGWGTSVECNYRHKADCDEMEFYNSLSEIDQRNFAAIHAQGEVDGQLWQLAEFIDGPTGTEKYSSNIDGPWNLGDTELGSIVARIARRHNLADAHGFNWIARTLPDGREIPVIVDYEDRSYYR